MKYPRINKPAPARGLVPKFATLRGFGFKGWLLLTAIFLIAGDRPLRSQQEPTFSTDVKVVNVLATVRNKQGQIVRNLTKDDFTLDEDGHAQTIRYFSQMADLPLTIGLLVDTSPSQTRVLEQERSASYTFLDQVLREDKDLAFVIHFEGEAELLQDLTSSRKQLDDALGELRASPVDRGGGYGGPSQAPQQWPGGGGGGWPGSGGGGWPGGGGRSPWPGGAPPNRGPIPSGRGRSAAGGTALYDAVFLASDDLMRKQGGRKSLIILSDGVDTASKETVGEAIEAAQRSDTIVYSILFYDAQAYDAGGGFGGGGYGGGMGRRRGGMGGPGFPQQISHPDGKRILDRISKETGGRMFEVSKKLPIDAIYKSIQEELRNQYSLGYSPERPDSTPGYRRIHLTTRQRDLNVQTRDGYYAR